MSVWRVVRAELAKCCSLPSFYGALALAVLATLAPVALEAHALAAHLDAGTAGELHHASTIDIGLAAGAVGVIGVIVLGVVMAASEYTGGGDDVGGGQAIATSLLVVPGRLLLLAGKLVVLAIVTALAAAILLTVSVVVAQIALADHGHPVGFVLSALGWRTIGAGVYWVLMALIAFAFALLTRGGVVPLVILIANSSLVSVSYLLSRVTGWAKYLPDVAGMQMFTAHFDGPHLDAVLGGVTMAAWTVALVAIAALAFAWRDA